MKRRNNGLGTNIDTVNSLMNETGDIISPTKINIEQENVDEEDEENGVDKFAEQYLDTINGSVISLSPENIRVKD
jgi:hypothetical protein